MVAVIVGTYRVQAEEQQSIRTAHISRISVYFTKRTGYTIIFDKKNKNIHFSGLKPELINHQKKTIILVSLFTVQQFKTNTYLRQPKYKLEVYQNQLKMEACFKTFDKDELIPINIYIEIIFKIFRDGSINMMEFTTLCIALFRNDKVKPYK